MTSADLVISTGKNLSLSCILAISEVVIRKEFPKWRSEKINSKQNPSSMTKDDCGLGKGKEAAQT